VINISEDVFFFFEEEIDDDLYIDECPFYLNYFLYLFDKTNYGLHKKKRRKYIKRFNTRNYRKRKRKAYNGKIKNQLRDCLQYGKSFVIKGSLLSAKLLNKETKHYIIDLNIKKKYNIIDWDNYYGEISICY